jgi:hypothetical protein
MGESLSGDGTRVRAVPTGRDAALIPRGKRESRRVGLWFASFLLAWRTGARLLTE